MAHNQITETYGYGGQGVVSVALRNALGKPLGFRQVGEVDELKIALDVSMEYLRENQTGNQGKIKRRRTEQSCKLTANWLSRERQNLAHLLYGESAVVAAGSATDQAITAFTGLTISLGYLNVSSVVLTSVDGLTTYDDYTVNPEWGSINVTAGGDLATAIAAAVAAESDEDGGLPIHADFSFGDQVVVDALTTIAPDLWLRFEGLNDVESSKPVTVDAFRFASDPLKELVLVNPKGFAPMSVSGEVMSDMTRPAGKSKFFEYRFGA